LFTKEGLGIEEEAEICGILKLQLGTQMVLCLHLKKKKGYIMATEVIMDMQNN